MLSTSEGFRSDVQDTVRQILTNERRFIVEHYGERVRELTTNVDEKGILRIRDNETDEVIVLEVTVRVVGTE